MSKRDVVLAVLRAWSKKYDGLMSASEVVHHCRNERLEPGERIFYDHAKRALDTLVKRGLVERLPGDGPAMYRPTHTKKDSAA